MLTDFHQKYRHTQNVLQIYFAQKKSIFSDKDQFKNKSIKLNKYKIILQEANKILTNKNYQKKIYLYKISFITTIN